MQVWIFMMIILILELSFWGHKFFSIYVCLVHFILHQSSIFVRINIIMFQLCPPPLTSCTFGFSGAYDQQQQWKNHRCVCLDRSCLWSLALSIVLLCARGEVLCFSPTLKQRLVGADQPITDILTHESGVETAFYQPPSVSCCFGENLSPK